MRLLKPYIMLFLGIFFLNFLIQGFLLRGWNDVHLQEIRGDSFSPVPLIINYLIQTAGLVYLFDKLKVWGKPREAAMYGGLIGGLLFLNFGLSNLFLLPYYPIEMIISDTIATIIAFSLASAFTAKLIK